MGVALFLMQCLWLLLLSMADSLKLLFTNIIPSSLLTKKSVKDEIALITGGGSGFGQLLSVRLAKLGCEIVIWDVNDKGCDETIRMVKEVNGKIRKYILDVSNKEEVYRVAKQVREEVGPVTILVNNAGIAHKGALWETSDALFDKVMAVNTMAHVWTLRAFLPHMLEMNQGHVVSISSMAGVLSSEKVCAYSVSKHAAVGLMNSLSMDLMAAGRTGVKTTLVCPYFSRTSLFDCDYEGYIPFVEAEAVVDSIVNGILTEKEVVRVPKDFVYVIWFSLFLTKKMMYKTYRLLGGESLAQSLKVRKVFQEQDDNID